MSAKGTKEKGRFDLLQEMVEICSGIRVNKGGSPLPELLDYSKNPLTPETNKQIQAYLKRVSAITAKLGYQANLALHMRKKRGMV